MEKDMSPSRPFNNCETLSPPTPGKRASRNRQSQMRMDLRVRLKDVAAIALLGLVTFVFYLPYLQGKVFFPWDIQDRFFPLLYYVASTLKAGEVPLWNPYMWGGMSLVGDPEIGIFYPGNWILFLLARFQPFDFLWLQTSIIVHYWLSGVFTYLLCHYLLGSRLGAIAGALVFMFGGFLVGRAQTYSTIASATWIPLIIYSFLRALRDEERPWIVLAGLALGTSALAGHLLVVYYTALSLAVIAGYEYWARTSGRWHPDLAKKMGASLVIVGTIALGISAVQLLPTYEYSRSLVRDVVSTETTFGGLRPQNLLLSVLSNFTGGNSGLALYWGENDITESHTVYLGILPLILAISGAIGASNKDARLFACLAIAFLVLALGENTFVHMLFYRVVPFYSSFRRPTMALSLFSLSIAVLAGCGVSNLLIDEPQRTCVWKAIRRGVVLILAALALLALLLFAQLVSFSGTPTDRVFKHASGALDNLALVLMLGGIALVLLHKTPWTRASDRWRAPLFIALIFFELATFGSNQGFNSTSSGPTTEEIEEITRTAERTIHNDDSLYRVEINDLSAGGIKGFWHYWTLVSGFQNAWGSPKALFVPKNYLVFRGLMSPWAAQVVEDWRKSEGGSMLRLLLGKPPNTIYGSSLFPLLNAKYILAHKELSELDPGVNISTFPERGMAFKRTYLLCPQTS